MYLNSLTVFIYALKVVNSRFKPNVSLKNYLSSSKLKKEFFEWGSIKDFPRDEYTIDYRIADCKGIY